MESSRKIYDNILCTQESTRVFYIQMAALLEQDPYFFQAYLEMLWNAEERKDHVLYKEILIHSLYHLKKVLFDAKARGKWFSKAEFKDIEALQFLLKIAREQVSFLHQEKYRLLFLEHIGKKYLKATHKKPLNNNGIYLKKLMDVDVSCIKQELNDSEPYWWQIETKRQEMISHHQHTHSIIIRYIQSPQITYNPVDGPHESISSSYVAKYARTHSLILQIAKDLGVGLGRVALVRMQPYSQAYRHCDNEPFLKGRNRYHLVISSGKINILESGNQKQSVSEGELWQFNNDVFHRAHNLSPVPRTHIIFDGYDLE